MHLPGVNLSPSIEENFDDVYVTSRSSETERSVVGDISVFLIGSSKQKQLNDLIEKKQELQNQKKLQKWQKRT